MDLLQDFVEFQGSWLLVTTQSLVVQGIMLISSILNQLWKRKCKGKA